MLVPLSSITYSLSIIVQFPLKMVVISSSIFNVLERGHYMHVSYLCMFFVCRSWRIRKEHDRETNEVGIFVITSCLLEETSVNYNTKAENNPSSQLLMTTSKLKCKVKLMDGQHAN